jgi:hypothetical protein
MGGTFFALAFMAFTSLTTVDLLMNERRVVEREARGGYYSPATYLLAKLALDGALLRMLPALLYWAPFYFMAGFRDGAAPAAVFALTLVTFTAAVGALSMAVAVGSDTAGQASFVMNFILLFSLAFTGFLVNVTSIPEALRWIHYLSVFYYAFEAMLTSELAGRSFTLLYQPVVSCARCAVRLHACMAARLHAGGGSSRGAGSARACMPRSSRESVPCRRAFLRSRHRPRLACALCSPASPRCASPTSRARPSSPAWASTWIAPPWTS